MKQVLKNIYLSFYYGAKIGVLGLNGAGKSSLLKIIAGEDKSFNGEVVFSPGYSVGYLPQEPILDNSKTVKEVVMEGVADVVNILQEYEAVNNKFAEPMSDDEMNALIERQGELTELIEQYDAWELDAKLNRAMDALNCPEPEAKVETPVRRRGRRVALCRLLPKNRISCCWMNRPTTLMPNRYIGSKCIYNNIKVRLLPLPTTVIF